MSGFERFKLSPDLAMALSYSVLAGAVGGGLIGCASLVSQWIYTNTPVSVLNAIAPLLIYFIVGFLSGVFTCAPILFQGILFYLSTKKLRLGPLLRILVAILESAIVSFLVAYFLVFKVLWASLVLGLAGGLGVFIGLFILQGKYWIIRHRSAAPGEQS